MSQPIWTPEIVEEWNRVTSDLRRHKGLDKIPITTKHRDLREKIRELYGNEVFGIQRVRGLMGVNKNDFSRKCRGELAFTKEERKVLTRYFMLTVEEQECYFDRD